MDRDAQARELAAVLRSTTDRAAVADARQRLVRLHMDVARTLAHHYGNRGVDTEDLEQVAYLELVAVARTYDPRKGESFMAYAVPSIKGALRRHFRDRGWMVRPPRRAQELEYDVRRAVEELQQRLGRSPRPSDIAAHLGVPLEAVLESLSVSGCFTPASLDRPVGEDAAGVTLVDLLPAAQDDFAAAEARALLRPLLRRLGERDRRILGMRFFEQRSQQEIADDIGVTQMQVSRLLSRILRQLHGSLGEPASPARTQGGVHALGAMTAHRAPQP